MKIHILVPTVVLAALFSFLSACFAGAPTLNVELQWSLCPANFHDAAQRLNVASADVKARSTYFFDTRDGDYYRDGIVFRIRDTGKRQVLTVKIRNLNPDSIPAHFWHEDFKCETDKYRQQVVMACSLNQTLDESDFRRVVDGHKKLREVLGNSQKEFLRLVRTRADALSDVALMGPAGQQVASLPRSNISADISLEYTAVGSYSGLQFSVRVPETLAVEAEKAAMQDLNARGLTPCSVEPPTVLSYLIDHQ